MTFWRVAKSTGRGGGWWRATTGRANGSRPLIVVGRAVGWRKPRLLRSGLTPGRRATSLRASWVRSSFSSAGCTGRAPVKTLRGTAVCARHSAVSVVAPAAWRDATRVVVAVVVVDDRLVDVDVADVGDVDVGEVISRGVEP